jgi:hypothetical protein
VTTSIFDALSRDTETRGTLRYELVMYDGTREVSSMTGWFRLSGDYFSVMARKDGGRKVWPCCRAERVIGFTPDA